MSKATNCFQQLPFLPFHLSALFGKSSRSFAGHKGPLRRALLLVGNNHPHVWCSCLHLWPEEWFHWSSFDELPVHLLIRNGPGVGVCQRSGTWHLPGESHAPLPLGSSCPASTPTSSTLFLHEKWLSSIVLSTPLKHGWRPCPNRTVGCLGFSLIPSHELLRYFIQTNNTRIQQNNAFPYNRHGLSMFLPHTFCHTDLCPSFYFSKCGGRC